MKSYNHQKFCIQQNIIFEELDGEAIIVNRNNGYITSLNRTGTFIFNQLNTHPVSYDKLLQSIKNVYKIDIKTIQTDLNDFLEKLLEVNIIKIVN